MVLAVQDLVKLYYFIFSECIFGLQPPAPTSTLNNNNNKKTATTTKNVEITQISLSCICVTACDTK